MSFPTIVVSPSNVESSIQVATPFSYTFTNSGPVPPGSNTYDPFYQANYPDQVTFTTTGSYSSNNTLVTSLEGVTDIQGIYGIQYLNADIDVGSEFTFKIPYISTGARGTIGFTLNFLTMYSAVDGERNITNGSYDSNGLVNFQYFDGDTITYKKRSDSGFDILCNSTVQFIDPFPYSIQFNTNFFWYPFSYPDWNESNQYNIGEQVRVSRINFESVIDININNYPDSSTNYLKWQYLHSSNTTYDTWSTSVNYTLGSLVKLSGSNYISVAFSNTANNPTALSNFKYWKPIAEIDNTISFNISAPDKIVYYPATFPSLYLSSLTSSQVRTFVSGEGTSELIFASTTGFQSVPTSNLTLIVFQTLLGNPSGTPSSNTITVEPIVITVNPELSSVLSLVTYQPFEYIYSIPTDVVNVVLQANALITSSNLNQYIGYNGSFETSFSSFIGLTSSGISYLQFDAVLGGNTILTSKTTTITTSTSSIIITPPIPTGSLALYRYEAFSYVFTTNSNSTGLTLQITRSSSELQTLCSLSSDQKTITFSGSFVNSFSTNLNLVVDLIFESTIIGTTTILVSVGQARFFPPSSNQNFQLYQNENISNTFGSNIQFLTSLAITSIVSIPSLPSGLTFGGSCNTWFIQGTPLLQVAQSNYQVIGSNSNNGRIASTIVSMKVNPQQVVITPNAPSISGLLIDSSATPVTLTAIQPSTISQTTFRYSWAGLPDGFAFQDINESNVTSPFIPPDSALTITLTGTPTLEFATLVAASGGNLYQMRLYGTQTENTGRQTTGSALFNFSFGETVLINVSNSVTLYKSKPLGVTDVLITAGSFFSSSTISNVTTELLPPGLSLVPYESPNVYRLSGTPTEVDLTGSYTFTATNFNNNSRSVTAIIPINPNFITFVGSTPSNGSVIRFIVSRPLVNAKTGYYSSPIIFTATSTANAYTIRYTSSINLADYGLALNSTSGALTGVPTESLSETTVTITATEDTLGTTGTTTIKLTILADEFNWSTYNPTYFQNKTITPFQFIAVSTLSERPIQSYSSTNLPTGLVLNAGGLLSGTPTEFPVGGIDNFIITATTGYSTLNSPSYTYSMIADQLLIIQTNGSDSISTVFTGIQYRAIQYSSDSLVNATFSIGALSPATSATISVTSGGIVSGDFTDATLNTTYSATLTAVFGSVTSTTQINIVFTSFTDSGIGSISIPTELSTLSFSQPTQTSFTLFEYVPYSITIQATGSSSFIYYYTSAIPIGFQFTKDGSGLTATLSGISPTLSSQGILVYAKIEGGYPISTSLTLRTITPFFVSPQLGAGAYTALLRNDVLGNAAQNARDNRVFPEVNPLAGPLMAPRAPDVVTPPDCLLNLCKKPCPTCRTMM